MFATQTTQFRLDEQNRCRDRSWLSSEDEKRFGETNPVNIKEQAETGSNLQTTQFNTTIQTGNNVFLPGNQFIGKITKLFTSPAGQITYLAVRTARLFGRHKLVPFAVIGDFDPERVALTISREQFFELPGFKADSTISEEVDRALWNDVVLRFSDYRQIDTQVRDGIISLSGHVVTSMNHWRAETAVKNIPGILGFKNYLIPDDKLAFEVAEAAGQGIQGENSRIFTKVQNGLAVLSGEVSSISIRDEIEQRIAVIPWVRGIINAIRVPGVVFEPEDQRFLQPLIGKELIFKDGVSTIVRKVVINPHNRRVIAVILWGRFPLPLHQEPGLDEEEHRRPERLMVLPAHLILYLTNSAGLVQINSDQITEYEVYDPSRYILPGYDWLPPYPYCPEEVLFPAQLQPVTFPDPRLQIGITPDSTPTNEQIDKSMEEAIHRFENEGGRTAPVSMSSFTASAPGERQPG